MACHHKLFLVNFVTGLAKLAYSCGFLGQSLYLCFESGTMLERMTGFLLL